MTNYFKRYERFAFMILILLTTGSSFFGLYCVISDWPNGPKWLATAGLLATVAGVVQLEVSGFFERIMEHYINEEKYPYGPPSFVTREIIDNPDRPVATWIKNVCFFNVKTGFWLIVLGILFQIAAVWL